ncbi:MAG: polysaccharide deacetylase family protein [Bacteroidales bacterium]
MKGILNRNKINYVLAHLSMVVNISGLVEKNRLVFTENFRDDRKSFPAIYFPLSSSLPDLSGIKSIDSIPVLFPLSDREQFFSRINNSIIFNDDLIKSAFYLLSGYQEQYPAKRDAMGRYRYRDSIQHRLNIITRPLVNYYFEIIAEGIREFCRANSFAPEERHIFKPFGFVLSHDVDQIRQYTFNNLVHKTLQLTGLKKRPCSTATLSRQVSTALAGWLSTAADKDPYWNFDRLMAMEKDLGLSSVFYFLDKDLKHQDAYYRLTDKRIILLLRDIQNQGNETGLHGTVRSATQPDAMRELVKKYKKAIADEQPGIRQHRLLYQYPLTSAIHEDNGFLYDATLGFAEHEGFRNSFCYPFKLYNFEQDRPFKTWQIPLNIMDVTLFHYRRLSYPEALASIRDILAECKKFGGVFTILWHNSFFDEYLYPGISDFYQHMLEKIMEEDPEPHTGKEIIHKMENYSLFSYFNA